jgi:hypothetical protein
MLIKAIIILSYHAYYHYHSMEEEADNFLEKIDETYAKNGQSFKNRANVNQKHRTTALLYSFLLGTFGADWYGNKDCFAPKNK